MMDVGTPRRLTESGFVSTPTGRLLGFFVTKVGGTLELREPDGKDGKQLVGPFTPPSVGWYPLPISAGYRFQAVIEGELAVTFSVC